MHKYYGVREIVCKDSKWEKQLKVMRRVIFMIWVLERIYSEDTGKMRLSS